MRQPLLPALIVVGVAVLLVASLLVIPPVHEQFHPATRVQQRGDPTTSAAATSAAATSAAAPTAWLEDFQFETSDPQPFLQSSIWDVYTHTRGRGNWQTLEPMLLGHDAHCAAPPATRPSANPRPYEDAAFRCRDHMMTAIYGSDGTPSLSGYALVFLTPNRLVDVSNGEVVIRLDVSTLRETVRDWWDITITPYEDNLVGPLLNSVPDLQGEAKRGLRVRMGQNSGKTPFAVDRIENHLDADLGGSCCAFYEDIPGFVISAQRRDTFELRISRTHVKFWMPQYNLVTIDKAIPDLGFEQGILQIGHHSYSSEKQCLPGIAVCGPITFHWDNISISPSMPFTMIRSRERAAFEQVEGEVLSFTFPQPAPTDTHLRVSAIGGGYQVSVDGGASWVALSRQDQAKDNRGTFASYWHPIPAGTQAVQFRTTERGWWGPGGVEYAAFWSRTLAQLPETTPTPGAPPTVTPAAATPTASVAPSSTALAATPTPTLTLTPTSGTAPSGCVRVVYRVNQAPVTESCP